MSKKNQKKTNEAQSQAPRQTPPETQQQAKGKPNKGKEKEKSVPKTPNTSNNKGMKKTKGTKELLSSIAAMVNGMNSNGTNTANSNIESSKNGTNSKSDKNNKNNNNNRKKKNNDKDSQGSGKISNELNNLVKELKLANFHEMVFGGAAPKDIEEMELSSDDSDLEKEIVDIEDDEEAEVLELKSFDGKKKMKNTSEELSASDSEEEKQEEEEDEEGDASNSKFEEEEEDDGINLDLAMKKLIIEPDIPWYDVTYGGSKVIGKQAYPNVSMLLSKGEALLQQQSAIFHEQNHMSKSEKQWIESVLKSGTMSDKVAAMTLLIQDGQLYRLSTLKTLLGLCQKKGKEAAMLACDTMKDLLINYLLPDRKLIYFKDRPLGDGMDQKQLLLWYCEDSLKKTYLEFLVILENHLHDTTNYVRNKSLTTVFDLLVAKPEQEKSLLSLIVNKLGDLDKKIASKASYLLLKLLSEHHPNMKLVVIKETEQLLYRPNVSERSQYYALIFLNQIVLTAMDVSAAVHLIDVYFGMFKLVMQKGDVEGKILSAILTGIHRAFPFAKNDLTTSFDEHVSALFTVVHSSNFNNTIQALQVLYQVITAKHEISNRFYRTLFDSLLDPNLPKSSKHGLYINLLFKSLKHDENITRIKSFFKRILQVCSKCPPGFICAMLYMFSEVIKLKPILMGTITSPNAVVDEEEDDGEEKFIDVDEETEAARQAAEANDQGKHVEYQYLNADPRFLKSEHSLLWEISAYLDHFHPSVVHFAKSLIDHGRIEFTGDPLQLYTLAHFLDRFAYRNPKANVTAHRGFSLMQPERMLTKVIPVNSPQFLLKGDVDALKQDEKFFYQYFKTKAEEDAKKQPQKKSDEEEDEDDEFENVDSDDEAWGEIMAREEKLYNNETVDDDQDLIDALKAEDWSDSGSDSEFDEIDEEDDDFGEAGVGDLEDDDLEEIGSGEEDGDIDDEDFNDMDFRDDTPMYSDDEDIEDEIDYALEEEEMNDLDDEDDDDDNALAFEDDIDVGPKQLKKMQKGKDGAKGNLKKRVAAVMSESAFADAEEFAHLIEGDEAQSDKKRKQLQWESGRYSKKQKRNHPPKVGNNKRRR